MARSSLPRRQADRRAGGPARLRVECLEDRAVPANLVSTDFTLTASAGESAVVGASADGRYVIVQSTSANFVDDQIDTNGVTDLFWLDRISGERFLISAEAGTQGLSATGVVPSVPGQTANAVISADGQTVAFVSKANAQRLIQTFRTTSEGQDAGDTTEDVFAWKVEVARNLSDRNTGSSFDSAVTLVSEAFFGSFGLNEAVGLISRATNPSISADGSFVSYVSARNASAIVGNSFSQDNQDFTPDVFRVSISNSSVSVSASSSQLVTRIDSSSFNNIFFGSAFGRFTGFVDVDPLGRYMSGDGSAFAVRSNLSPSLVDPTFSQTPSGAIDAYYINLDTDFFFNTDRVVLASNVPGRSGTSAGGQVQNAIIPPDAPNTIVFSASLPAGGPGIVSGYTSLNGNLAELYWRRIVNDVPQTAILVSSAAGQPTVGANAGLSTAVGSFATSADGSTVFFTSAATNLVSIVDTNGTNDVFVRDIETGITSAVSVVAGGASTGNAASGSPRPTADGFLVAFESKATNLSAVADTNAGTDIFVRDLIQGTTGLASASADNTSTGNTPSFGPVIGGSKDNAVVLFNSQATNLDVNYNLRGGVTNVYAAAAPIAPAGVDRIVAVSGGLNGFAGLAQFTATGALQSGPPIAPFAGFRGEVRVAAADVDGDGVADLIAGAGPGGSPRVRVLSGLNFGQIADIAAFESTFTGGVYVASADFNGDGFADIVVGAGLGGGPRIRIFDGRTQGQLADIFVFEQAFRGGVRVATGDVNGDGVPDLIAAAGELGGPRIRIIDGTNLAGLATIADFFAFEQTLRNGVYVGAGDTTGDGLADVVVGAGPGGSPRVSVFDASVFLANPASDPETARVINFFAYDDASRDGVRVAAKTADGDPLSDIVTGPGSGAPLVRVFSSSQFVSSGVPQQLSEQFAFDEPAGRLGAFVG